MPLVRIDLMEGRPAEVRLELHDRVARLVAEIVDAPLENVRTYITEIPADNWGIGGVPASIARREQIEARAAKANALDG
jgi:4-oxalocrotonate tautomerase